MREPGFYWVKDYRGWQVARWDGALWAFVGSEDVFGEDDAFMDFHNKYEVGERVAGHEGELALPCVTRL